LSVASLNQAFARGLRPPPQLSLAEWSEKNIILSPEDSAAKGHYTTERWEFQREPMEVMSPRHPAERVCILAASQTLKTRLLLNLLAYVIAEDPGPVLFVEPTAQVAESVSKDRVAPMIRDTPALRGAVADAKSRDSGNTIEHKKFKGGHASFAFATSPSSLATRPIRYLLLDEISREEYSSSNEGDPVRLAEKRTITFYNRKIVYASSPSNDGACRISDVFEHSDQRQWHVPCPYCNHFQVIEWQGLVWSQGGQPVKYRDERGVECEKVIPAAQPQYRCEACENLIPERRKPSMNANGRYVPANPQGLFPGFRINQLASPIRTWGDIVQEWLECQGKPEQLKVFVNTVLAETWKEKGERPDWEKLYGRREKYELGSVPAGVLFLTAGADVQDNRIEASLYGWGRNRECWLIEHAVFYGKPTEQKVWNDFASWKGGSWKHASGAQMQILLTAVDTGHATNDVYAWVRTQGKDVLAVDGRQSVSGAIVGQPSMVDVDLQGRKIRRGVAIWPVDTTKLKYELYGRLNLPAPEDNQSYPTGWVHIPEIGPEFCRQLVAEQVVTKTVRGYKKIVWEKIGRNEALDTWVYARAAAHQAGSDRASEEVWVAMEHALGIIELKAEPIEEPSPIKVEAKPAMPPMPTSKPRDPFADARGTGGRSGGWLDRGRNRW
jgi:phage terminase large subunit GpA-like protein